MQICPIPNKFSALMNQGVATPDSPLFAGGTFRSNDYNLSLDTVDALQYASMYFKDAGVHKWAIYKMNLATHELVFTPNDGNWAIHFCDAAGFTSKKFSFYTDTGNLDVYGGISGTNLNLTDNTGLLKSDGTVILADDGTLNLFLGAEAFNNDSGATNLGVGYRAGYNNDTTGGGTNGQENVYIGCYSGAGATPAIKNTGKNNVGVGAFSLYFNTTGYSNAGIGVDALYSNTTGYWNTGIGAIVLECNTTGYSNTAIGASVLATNISGHGNTGIGAFSLRFTVSSYGNTAIGFNAGNLYVANGGVFIGNRAGQYQTTVDNVFIIDNQDRTNAATEITNSLVYGVFDADPANQTLRINAAITGTKFISNIAIGTSPYACISTTLNTNLNADLWDGYQFSGYLNQAVKTTSTVDFGSIFMTGTNTTTKLCIQNASAVTIFDVDTINGRVGIGAMATDVKLKVTGYSHSSDPANIYLVHSSGNSPTINLWVGAFHVDTYWNYGDNAVYIQSVGNATTSIVLRNYNGGVTGSLTMDYLGNTTATGKIKGAGYISSDGSEGVASGSFTDLDGYIITVKNGLITAIT
jgi:hypothetical protein